MFSGQAVSLNALENDLVELILDLKNESVNKLNTLTLSELDQAVSLLESSDVKGLLIILSLIHI